MEIRFSPCDFAEIENTVVEVTQMLMYLRRKRLSIANSLDRVDRKVEELEHIFSNLVLHCEPREKCLEAARELLYPPTRPFIAWTAGIKK